MTFKPGGILKNKVFGQSSRNNLLISIYFLVEGLTCKTQLHLISCARITPSKDWDV